MKYLVTGKEMKLLDQNTSDCFKVPELVLMEQAAMNFVEKLLCILGKENKKGIVFCGLGNNGADGIAIARLLNERGIYTEICKIKDILSLSDKTTDSYGVQEDVYKAYGYPIQTSFTNFLEKDYENLFVVDFVGDERIHDLSSFCGRIEKSCHRSSENLRFSWGGAGIDLTLSDRFCVAKSNPCDNIYEEFQKSKLFPAKTHFFVRFTQ